MPTAKARPKVLVVDDQDSIRKLVRTVLEGEGFPVVEAADGATALEVAATEQPTVVILDVMMPGLDGVAVCAQLDHDAVKVVMLTARDDPRVEDAARDVGADAFLTKPFSPEALVAIVEELS